MSEHIKKSHNKTLILYHIVCPAKYRRKIFSKKVINTFKTICMEIGDRYELHFVEIGAEGCQVLHLLNHLCLVNKESFVNLAGLINPIEVCNL